MDLLDPSATRIESQAFFLLIVNHEYVIGLA